MARTEITRTQLTQEVRIFVPPCPEGAGLVRKVQLLIPQGDPQVLVGLDVLPEDIGPNRVYKLAPVPSNQDVKFTLDPCQWLVGAVNVSHLAITVIVQYCRSGTE